MAFQIDTNLHWTDHYVRYGFCVIKRAVPKPFCEAGVAAYQKALGTSLPPQQWSTETLSHEHLHGRINLHDPELRSTLETAYDLPGVQEIAATMFGGYDKWSGMQAAAPFLAVYHEENEQSLMDYGHVDFAEVRIPIIGDALVMQISLVDTEPFSGNITIYPSIHKPLQQRLLNDEGFWYADTGPRHDAWRAFTGVIDPYEFVAEAGDVLLFHHQVGHGGNVNAAANRSPRVAIHAQLSQKDWPNAVDPDRPNISPWERSVSLNGKIDLPYDERTRQAEAYQERASRASRPPQADKVES